MKKMMLLVAICIIMFSSVIMADTNSPEVVASTNTTDTAKIAVPGLGDLFKIYFDLALDYIATNGVMSVGYGISADSHIHGTLVSTSLKLDQLSFNIHKTLVTPGIENGVLFNSKPGGVDYHLVGVNVLIHWFRAPPWVETLQSKPILKSVIFPKFSEWYFQPSADYPSDKFVNGQFYSKYIIIGIKGGWKFN